MNGLNAGGEGMLVVPTPREKPVFDVVAEYQGLKLCRISDAVPYCECFYVVQCKKEKGMRELPTLTNLGTSY